MTALKNMKIGLITFIDPAAPGAKQDKLGAEVERVIASIFSEPSQFVHAPVPNDRKQLRAALVRLCDEEKCPLVLKGPCFLGMMTRAMISLAR